MLKNYKLGNIRTLFKEGFSESELRGIYFEQPVFRPVFEEVSEVRGKDEIVHQLIDYARRRLEIEPLLAWAKEHNPKRYELHQPYEDSPAPPLSQAQTRDKFIINLPNLLQILGNSIYTEPDVAVREMIQNAHDTCIIRQVKERGFVTPQIYITWSAQTLSVSDNGAGMTKDELKKYLSTVGDGLTKVVREKLRDAGAEEALLLVGQFGIGILSAFSVANWVEVFTHSYLPNSPGLKWVCRGDIDYTVEPSDKPEIGTRLVLHLNNKGLALLEDDGRRLKQIIKKYTDFISIPILLEKYGQINSITPPWQPGQQADLHQYLIDRYGLEAIEIIPFNCQQPVHIEGLLFVPLLDPNVPQSFGEVDIYISRVFITEKNKDLLPSWARFIKGVVNSASLNPTLSRDAVVKDEIYEQVRTILGRIILNHLEGLAQTEVGLEKLQQIVDTYDNLIKADALKDDAFFRRISRFVRVSTVNGRMTMEQYLVGSKDVIYYFKNRTSLTLYKEIIGEKDFPIIDASLGMQVEFLKKYAQLFGKDIKCLEEIELQPTSSDGFSEVDEEVDEKWRKLEEQFLFTIHVEAKAIDFALPAVPAILVDNLLQLNTKNELIQELCTLNPNNKTFKLALKMIYNNAYLQTEQYLSPAKLKAVLAENNAAFTAMIKDTCRVAGLENKITQMNLDFKKQMRQSNTQQPLLTPYRSCFFAYPFQPQFHALRDEIKRLLTGKYGVKLMATSIEMKNASIIDDIKQQIAETHFGIADVTGNNPNVLWALGLMVGYGKPVIILKDNTDTTSTPFDLYGNYQVVYQLIKDEMTGEIEYPSLPQKLRPHLKRILAQSPELEQATMWTNEVG